jgi:hypothetical protein
LDARVQAVVGVEKLSMEAKKVALKRAVSAKMGEISKSY